MLPQADVDEEENALHEARHLPQASISSVMVALESGDGDEQSAGSLAERNVCTCLCHALPSRQSAKCMYPAAARDERGIEWQWDRERKSDYASISESGSEVHFHAYYSSGTSAVRGTKPFTKGQHYWEIKMTSSVYGTDMMVGFGTDAAELNAYADVFVSFLGLTSETWGLSYLGHVWHHGVSRAAGRRFGQDSVVGVHLDMWLGRAAFFIDGQLIGTAFTTGLRGKKLFPMVCSTAARTSMRIVRTCSAPDSLQFACCQALRRLVPAELKVTDVLPLPPGLRHMLDNNVDWLVRPCRPFAQTNVEDRSSSESMLSAIVDSSLPSSSPQQQQQQLLQQRHQVRPDRAAGLLQPSASAVAAARKRCMRPLAGVSRPGCGPHRPLPSGAVSAAASRPCGNGWKRLKGETDDPNGTDGKDSSDDQDADDDPGCTPRVTQEDYESSSSSSCSNSCSDDDEGEPDMNIADGKD